MSGFNVTLNDYTAGANVIYFVLLLLLRIHCVHLIISYQPAIVSYAAINMHPTLLEQYGSFTLCPLIKICYYSVMELMISCC